MVIVEGPDGAGKTTLVQRISQATGWPVQPRTVSKEAEAVVPLGEWVEEQMRLGFGPRIYDRFSLISSPNYIMLPSPTFRDECYDREWLMMQWHSLEKIDPVIIVCLPPLQTVVDNVMGDRDNEVVQPWIDRIYGLYVNFVAMQHWNSSLMVWDYTDQAPRQSQRLGNLLRWATTRIEKETR